MKLRRTVFTSTLLICGLVSAAAARAGDATYSASDIVNFFVPPPEQVTRGLCAGTDEECAATKTPAKPSSFDLMVSFGKNSDALTEDAMNNLLQFVIALRDPRLAGKRFAVEGFTDAAGDDAYNMKLSERRARSVAAFLEEMGIGGDRLEAKGYGETRMRTADANDPANRRVETRIIGN